MKAILAVLVASLLAACTGAGGGDATESAATSPTPVPTTVGADNPPGPTGEAGARSIERIVPVDGDLTEIVFALGLGGRVIATDLSATYPPEAAALPDIGYQRALNPEPIVAVDPSIVLATDLAGPPETLDALSDLGIPVVVIERDPTLAGPAVKIRAVADALGVPAAGKELAAEVDADIAAATSDVTPGSGPRVAVLYLRGDTVQHLFGAETTIGAVVEGIGAINVGAEIGISDTRQITTEALLAAAPDVLVVTTTGLESVGGIDGLLAIPGIAQTPAGAEQRVLAYEDQYLLGGGPRTGRLAAELATDLDLLPPGDAP